MLHSPRQGRLLVEDKRKPDTEDRTETGMEQLSAKKKGSQIFKIKKRKSPHFFYNNELKGKGKTMLKFWV